jgi:nucleoside-diphosphate-sugar epimerase
MKKVFITGASGFVGKNILNYFNNKLLFTIYNKENELNINEEFVFHFAGKAHDLKKFTSDADYYLVNTEFTKLVFDSFLSSDSKLFIILSSVKAVTDEVELALTEDLVPNPDSHYGKSKLLAEQYILSKVIPSNKRVFILRPCMIHGPGNKGNLNLLYNLVSKGFPWPLGSYENARSYLSIENLCFIIKELIENENIPSGVYNVADDVPLSTNTIIKLIAETTGKETRILKLCKPIIITFARFGDFLKLPLNTERLQKLTKSYVVSNAKINAAIEKPLPISSKFGLLKTFQSFSSNV